MLIKNELLLKVAKNEGTDYSKQFSRFLFNLLLI